MKHAMVLRAWSCDVGHKIVASDLFQFLKECLAVPAKPWVLPVNEHDNLTLILASLLLANEAANDLRHQLVRNHVVSHDATTDLVDTHTLLDKRRDQDSSRRFLEPFKSLISFFGVMR